MIREAHAADPHSPRDACWHVLEQAEEPRSKTPPSPPAPRPARRISDGARPPRPPDAPAFGRGRGRARRTCWRRRHGLLLALRGARPGPAHPSRAHPLDVVRAKGRLPGVSPRRGGDGVLEHAGLPPSDAEGSSSPTIAGMSPSRIRSAKRSWPAATSSTASLPDRKIPVEGRATVRLRGEARTLDRRRGEGLARPRLRRKLDHPGDRAGTRRAASSTGRSPPTRPSINSCRSRSSRPATTRSPTPLHEGIAMQFEAIVGGRWAGLGAPVDAPGSRLSRARARRPASNRRSATRASAPATSAEAYARAWASVYYLRTERPAIFVSLLDGLRAPAEPLAPRRRTRRGSPPRAHRCRTRTTVGMPR